jgi:hypothetical protein
MGQSPKCSKASVQRYELSDCSGGNIESRLNGECKICDFLRKVADLWLLKLTTHQGLPCMRVLKERLGNGRHCWYDFLGDSDAILSLALG